MKWQALTKTSFRSVFANKVRSFLTVLGIVIGIAAVITLLSLGAGARQEIIGQVQGLGANTINIVPVADFQGPSSRAQVEALLAASIDREFVDRLENKIKFPEITNVAPLINRSTEVASRSETRNLTVYGVNEAYFEVYDIELLVGRQLLEADINSQRNLTVIGPEVAEDLLAASLDESNDKLNELIGTELKIDGTSFEVVGVTTEKNQELDERIVVPITTAGNELFGIRDYAQISVEVTNQSLLDSTALKIEQELLDYYRITDPEDAPFSLFTSQEILSIVDTVTGIFTTLLTSIAAISLLVGGIGIMNIMLVSVTERTKEIGLRKAVGAKESSIMFQFLTESLILTLIGGIIGILLGFGLALIISNLGGIPALFTIESVLLATSVSSSIGILFGFYPAYRAAKLNPIDALRYE